MLQIIRLTLGDACEMISNERNDQDTVHDLMEELDRAREAEETVTMHLLSKRNVKTLSAQMEVKTFALSVEPTPAASASTDEEAVRQAAADEEAVSIE